MRRESWMRRSNSTNACDRRDAIRSVALHILIRLICAGLLLWISGAAAIQWLSTAALLLAAAGLIPIPFSLIALRQRLKELEEGELNEARKY